METAKKPKGCYHCVKRRIICDRTEPQCQKCGKKGLTCPGYGVRYRFASDLVDRSGRRPAASHSSSSPPPADARPEPSSSAAISGPLKWVDGLPRSKRKYTRRLPGGSDGSAAEADADADALGDDDDDEVEVINRPVPNHRTMVPLRPPYALQTIDAKTRFLFSHFSKNVSPTMLVFDGEPNGYRHQVLPLAAQDTLVQRAVCVAAAFHLLPHRPELQLPAERGRAAIIQKLRATALESSSVLTQSTWATILLLIVGDLIRGDEQMMTLYHMLDAFMRARGEPDPETASPLEQFLWSQSKLIKSFGRPILGESIEVEELGQITEQPHPESPRLLGSDKPLSNESLLQTFVPFYDSVFNAAARLYLLRAHSSGTPAEEERIAQQLRSLRIAVERIEPAYPGAHVVVWPCFVGAAESVSPEDRDYFTGQLQRIWKLTGYRNVLRAIDALPTLWARRPVERWTKSLPELSVIIM